MSDLRGAVELGTQPRRLTAREADAAVLRMLQQVEAEADVVAELSDSDDEAWESESESAGVMGTRNPNHAPDEGAAEVDSARAARSVNMLML